jgi:hypothetical protein
MATGFMLRHLYGRPLGAPACASEVTLVGVFGDKAAIVAMAAACPRLSK